MLRLSLSLRRGWKMLVCLVLILLLAVQVIPKVQASETNDPALIGGKDSGLINILLIGRDSSGETTARSDSLILCTFRPATKEIIITSFLRDLYVEIPGHTANRLNAAYAFGGMPLIQQTIQKNFHVYIDGCIEVDFSNFPKIIDALGGVTMELRQDEAESINQKVSGSLAAGVNLLNGEQALAYSRIRNLDSDGDFSRTSRQRKLLFSLLESYRNANLLTILSVVSDTLPMVSTNLDGKQILMLTGKLFPLLDEPTVHSQRIPDDGQYSHKTIRGMAVLVADLDKVYDNLYHSLLPGDASATS